MAFLTSTQPPLWAANPPQQNQREDRFLESLEIPQWGWVELVESLEEANSNALIFADEQESEFLEQSKKVEAWIADKSDAWLLRYYSLLGEACDVHDCCVDIDYLRIIRVVTEEGHDHVYPREAYISIGEEQPHTMDVNLVKSSVYLGGRSENAKKYATAFLENVGIKPLDAKVAIEKILEEYNVPGAKSTNKSIHLSHIRQFLFHISNHPSDIGLFRGSAFVLAKDSSGSDVFVLVRNICIDSPYMETGLAEFEEIHGRYALSSFYKGKLKKSEIADLLDLLINLGAMKQLEIVSASIWTNPDRRLWDGTLDGRNTVTRIDEDYTIRSLDEYICEENVSASKLIWKAVTSADAKVKLARYRPNKGYEIRHARSQLVCTLSSNEWIPNKYGLFCRPQDITRSELHEEFIYDDRNGLLTEIGFGEREKRLSEEYKNKNERAQELGFESADKASKWAQLDKLGISPDEILAKSNVIEQPESSVPNPDRRRKGVQERQENAPTKESITRERKIQPGLGRALAEAKAYLRPNYTNANDQLVCQCCHYEMPFKVNDAYYFEAVQCVPTLKMHHIENRLALCPTCSAMYQHARITGDEEIIRLIVDHQAPDGTPAVEIPINLAGKPYFLRFVGKHWFDLKTLLED